MANFIEADVIQKIATEAEWLTQTRIPYQGQIMIVSDSTGKVVNMKVGDGVNPFSDLNYMFDFTNSQRISAVPPGALPETEEANTYMVVTEVGDYTFGGNTIVSITEDGYQATLWWTGTTWVSNGTVRVKGDRGDGIQLKGSVENYADLSSISPTPQIGDSYVVNSDGLIYTYGENGFPIEGQGIEFITKSVYTSTDW